MPRLLSLFAALALIAALGASPAPAAAQAKKAPAKAAAKKSPSKAKAPTKAKPKGPTPFDEMMKNSEQHILPVHRLTSGPLRHWFSYYDVQQFDPTGRYVLCMAVGFEFRENKAEDKITIGMIDLKDNDRWTTLGTSTAWCWQQGCRLQWRPGSDREVLWNDREDGRYVCRILDVKTMKLRTIPSPIDHVSPDGKWALVADFARTVNFRCGYGYAGIPDPHITEEAPKQTGVWKVNLETGERTLLFSLADIAAIPTLGYTPGAKGRHYIQHLGWNFDGSRFIFLNRGDKIDRMFTANAEGKDIQFISNAPSHFCWRDNQTLLNWTRDAYRVYKADGSTGDQGEILFRAPNGHETCIPGGEWLLTDTYPQGKQTDQHLYLYNLKTGRKIFIGKFNQPAAYREARAKNGEPFARCDLHPRLSPDCTKITIDSTHEDGRQMYLIDISPIIGKKKE